MRPKERPARMYGGAFSFGRVAHGLGRGDETRDRDANSQRASVSLRNGVKQRRFRRGPRLSKMDCERVNRGDPATGSF